MPSLEIRGTSHVYDLTAPAASDVVLVFVHGWLLSRSYWRPLIDKLSPQFQCLSYDLRGFGDSCQLDEVRGDATESEFRLCGI